MLWYIIHRLLHLFVSLPSLILSLTLSHKCDSLTQYSFCIIINNLIFFSWVSSILYIELPPPSNFYMLIWIHPLSNFKLFLGTVLILYYYTNGKVLNLQVHTVPGKWGNQIWSKERLGALHQHEGTTPPFKGW